MQTYLVHFERAWHNYCQYVVVAQERTRLMSANRSVAILGLRVKGTSLCPVQVQEANEHVTVYHKIVLADAI